MPAAVAVAVQGPVQALAERAEPDAVFKAQTREVLVVVAARVADVRLQELREVA